MILVLLIIALTFASGALALPLFESVAALLLVTVALAFPVGQLLGVGPVTYLAILLVLLASLWLLQRQRGKQLQSKTNWDEVAPILVWVVGFLLIRQICLFWPDFISMGERLRDYAILSSVIQHPLEAREPWMSGAVLNYYLFWYRCGHFISTISGLPIWDTYHALQSFTLSLYLASFYRFATRYLKFSVLSSLGCAVVITFGSNVAGVINFATQDSNWWGPSRVIPGIINEFPAWSFLLGDLHPHFLNLPLLPVFVLIGLAAFPVFRSSKLPWASAGVAIFSAGATVAWTFGSNAWEVPFVLITLTCLLVGVGLFWRRVSAEPGVQGLSLRTFLALALVSVLIAASMYQATRNITPPGDPLRIVMLPIAPEFFSSVLQNTAAIFGLKIEAPVPAAVGTVATDLLRHWGFPLVLIALSLIFLAENRWEGIARGLAIIFGYLSGSALILLGFIALLALWRLVQMYLDKSSAPLFGQIAIELLGIAALLGIIFPEVLFVDDPYGGENERMNTVFKFYSAAWGFLHIYAFALTALIFRKIPRVTSTKQFQYCGWAVVITVSLGFFSATMKLRENSDFTIEPYSQGLSGIEVRYAGAAAAIQKLEQLPRGVVIEAVGGAYNSTSMVATLSGNQSFLGWPNHVQLLTKRNDEVARRETENREFYTQKNCEDRRAYMLKEGITYVVLGVLERQNYGEIDSSGFSCLNVLIQAGEYTIYTNG